MAYAYLYKFFATEWIEYCFLNIAWYISYGTDDTFLENSHMQFIRHIDLRWFAVNRRSKLRSFIRQIRSSLDDAMAASVASALVSSRLDQMNCCFLWYCSITHRPSSASSACNGQSRGKPTPPPPFSSNELLKQLHWLPLETPQGSLLIILQDKTSAIYSAT